jgi:perosamine synthetase
MLRETLQIPMSSPDLSAAERQAVARVMRSKYLSFGPNLTAFERAVAEYVGVSHAIAVSSGTAGLHLAAIAAGVVEHDLVITSSFSFVASANCILYERGIPIFVDVDLSTGNLDPAAAIAAVEDIEAGGQRRERRLPPGIRSNSGGYPGRLKAILPVDVFGQPADLDPILETARKHGLAVIEDACEAIGAVYKNGRKAGAAADVAVFGFYPNKQMTTGEGGVMVTNHEEWAPLFKSLRNQGRDSFDAWLKHDRLGYNYRLDELSAALGAAQMQRLDKLLARREQVAGWYSERLRDVEGIEVPRIAATTEKQSWFVYVIRVCKEVERGWLMNALQESGIPSRPYFSPIHLQPFYAQRFGYSKGDLPVTEELGETSLALPFSSRMTARQVDRVCETLRRLVGERLARSKRSAVLSTCGGSSAAKPKAAERQV